MPEDARVLSYLAVRRALGLLGLALPTMLYVYARPLGHGMQPSISEFYHTHMGDLLVGCLLAIGIFLISYLGYPRRPGERLSDQWVSTLAGIGAIGVALFPVVPPDLATCPPGESFDVAREQSRVVTCPVQGFVSHWTSFTWIHFASATLFFLSLAVFCFFLFPKGHQTEDGRIDWSETNNRIYFVCGSVLLLSIALLGVYALAGDGTKELLREYNYVFWWESAGVFAFAISWLTKGKIRKGVADLMARPATEK
jgi:hypothetical protein